MGGWVAFCWVLFLQAILQASSAADDAQIAGCMRQLHAL
jgi:hypothetical protein